MLRVAIVAGEASGDILGAGLVAAIKTRYPDAVFEGIAGPCMIEQGCRSLFPMERLSVMGLVEVLERYAELSRIRRKLVAYFRQSPPDVFIGVDAPDFNLGLEEKLKSAGIRTVHYVSPSVWAWRRRRIKKIRKAVDLMLTLFPFESEFYRRVQVPVRFVGHPLADMIGLETDTQAARQALELSTSGQWLALLPGSRVSEVSHLAEPFIQAAQCCLNQHPDMKFVMPYVNEDTRALFFSAWQRLAPELPLTLVAGHSRDVMAAADVVLLASGTATLEAMLLKKPMVVAYRMSPLSYAIISRLVKIRRYALPNLLANDALVPELIQQQATPELLAEAVLSYFDQPDKTVVLQQRYLAIHQQLRQNASQTAAKAVLELVHGG